MHTRRTLLGSIAAASVPLAGCSAIPLPNGESEGDDGESGDFEQVQVDGQTLVVDLGPLSVETVNLVAPDGSAYASKDVPQGATTVEFDLGLSYSPGEYRVVASADDSTVAAHSLEIAPDLAITGIGVGANHPDRMPEKLNFSDVQAFVEVSNEGSGPGGVEQLLILGDVPNPTTELTKEDHPSGIYDTSDGFGNKDVVLIPPGKTITLFSTSKPFLRTGDGIECTSRSQSGRCHIEIEVSPGDNPVRTEVPIQYSPAEESGNCTIQLGERNS